MAVPDDVTAAFEAVRDTVRAVQPGYQEQHGRYWQGAATDGDGAVRAPGLPASWGDLGLNPPAGQIVAVDEYVGPEGPGFVVRAGYTDADNRSWSRADQTGPETYRDTGGWVSDDNG